MESSCKCVLFERIDGLVVIVVVGLSARVSANALKAITILIHLMHSHSKYDFWAVRRVLKLQINVSPLPYSTYGIQ